MFQVPFGVLFSALYSCQTTCYLIISSESLLFSDQNEAVARPHQDDLYMYLKECFTSINNLEIWLCPAVFCLDHMPESVGVLGIFDCASATKCWCEVLIQPLLLHNFQRPPLYLVQWPSLVCSSVASLNLRKAPSAKNMRHYWVCASSHRQAQRKTQHNWIVIEY